MANVFFNLPAPSTNGSGAAVDVSTMGALKTIVVANVDATFNIEISNEAVATQWATIATFRGGGEQSINVAAHWMRVTVSGYRSGTPDIEIGGTDDGSLFANLAVPAGDGAAASTDVSALGVFKTITVGATFRGSVIIEISEDNVTWAQVMTFTAPGQQTQVFAASHMRVRRGGVPTSGGGTPIVNVGGTDITGGGGGGGGAGNPQTFRYTVTGAEPDPTEITIALPAARASANYVVMCTQGGVTNILGIDCAVSSYTTTQFVMSLTGSATTGDVFNFHVVDLT